MVQNWMQVRAVPVRLKSSDIAGSGGLGRSWRLWRSNRIRKEGRRLERICSRSRQCRRRGAATEGSDPTGANAPDVVVEGMLGEAGEELVTGVIVGAEADGCSSSSSSSSKSSSSSSSISSSPPTSEVFPALQQGLKQVLVLQQPHLQFLLPNPHLQAMRPLPLPS